LVIEIPNSDQSCQTICFVRRQIRRTTVLIQTHRFEK